MLSALVLVIIALLGVVVYHSRKSTEIESNSDRMMAHAKDLQTMLELNFRSKSKSVSFAMAYAENVLDDAGEISLDTLAESLIVTNQETGNTRSISFYPLLINQQQLWNNHSIVDQVMEQTGVLSTIFQRIDGGFLRLSTNILNQRGQRAIGTYIPDSSPVAQALLAGKSYTGRAFVVNDYYLTAYGPLFLEGEVVGSLFTGMPEKDLGILEEKFNETTYMESGYPFLVDIDGNILIHPTEQGVNIAQSNVFQKMLQNPEGSFVYVWPENAPDAPKRRLFYRFFEPYQTFVAVSISEFDFVGSILRHVRILIFSAMFFSIFLVFFSIRHLMSRITTPINQISEYLERLSLGIQPENYTIQRKDEIGKIAASLNRLIDGMKATARFANEIEKKNFDHEFTPLSKDDALGNALIDMRNSLKKAETEEQKRKQEDRKRNWATEGLAQFSDILRRNNDNIGVLSSNIIRNMVKYLSINQGGLFVLNDEDPSERFLELTACYAFDREKFLTRKIHVGEGITGTCFLEKQTIYLKKVPQDYIHITSGLGEASPDSLLIVPLKLNQEVLGVMELASFNEFEPHEREFVEKIAESIASTLSGVKINMRTASLLEQSQQQAEEMKAQEEEMRQNMEELEATQEEIARKSEEQKLRDEQMQTELQKRVEQMRVQEEELRKALETMEMNQKEIEKLKEELSTLVDNMPGIVYQCIPDEDLTMDFISDYCEKLTGYKASDFIGNKNITYANLIHPDDREKVNAVIDKAIKGKTSYYTEYRLKHKDGSYHKVGEHGSLLMNKSREIHHLQGMVFPLNE